MAQPQNPAKEADIVKRIEAQQASVESNKGAFHLYLERESPCERNTKLEAGVRYLNPAGRRREMGRPGGRQVWPAGALTLFAHTVVCGDIEGWGLRLAGNPLSISNNGLGSECSCRGSAQRPSWLL